MIDTDIVIKTVTGKEIRVVYPERIGREYPTPWLSESKHSREWNIDVHETRTDRSRKDCSFVVGVWGSGYGDNAKVREIISVDAVIGFGELTNAEKLVSLEAHKQQENEYQEYGRKNRVIQGEAFDALLGRVEQLESLTSTLRRGGSIG